LFVQELK